ncbi:unnamed protein product [Toxocara canis]|uniref:Uncharacterized protein n=1 Tax=Toxocara canis TaxID=6265 RepID=A0A3P7HEK8_TOXCA|nr:unnamed protein product [Toxocara canis]
MTSSMFGVRTATPPSCGHLQHILVILSITMSDMDQRKCRFVCYKSLKKNLTAKKFVRLQEGGRKRRQNSSEFIEIL